MTKFLDGVAVLAILISNQYHAMHRQFGRVKRRERQ